MVAKNRYAISHKCFIYICRTLQVFKKEKQTKGVETKNGSNIRIRTWLKRLVKNGKRNVERNTVGKRRVHTQKKVLRREKSDTNWNYESLLIN